MECSDKCKGLESMNPAKEWSCLRIDYAVLEEEDAFGADSLGWSRKSELFSHMSQASCR